MIHIQQLVLIIVSIFLKREREMPFYGILEHFPIHDILLKIILW